MTNYEAIIKMPPERMEQFLDQVYLAGMNNGMYAVRQEDDNILDRNPFDLGWLSAQAEEATTPGFDEYGEEYMLSALVEAIFRNAGIDL